jgi:hypothetical protein
LIREENRPDSDNADSAEIAKNTEDHESTEAPTNTEVSKKMEVHKNHEASMNTDVSKNEEAPLCTEASKNTEAPDNTEISQTTEDPEALEDTEAHENNEGAEKRETSSALWDQSEELDLKLNFSTIIESYNFNLGYEREDKILAVIERFKMKTNLSEDTCSKEFFTQVRFFLYRDLYDHRQESVATNICVMGNFDQFWITS